MIWSCLIGWLDCPQYGDAVGYIIPSKVPLGESFNDKITLDKRYSPQQAIRQQRHLGREVSTDFISGLRPLRVFLELVKWAGSATGRYG